MTKRKREDARPFWTIDAETDPFLHGRVPKPFIWGLYDGLEFFHFETCEELVNYISEYDVIVYAHNGGKFDFHFLLDYVNTAERVTVINGRLVSAKIGKAEIRDSWNLLPVPLATFGSKLEIDYAIMEAGEREKPENMREIIRYLEVDCSDLWTRIHQFETQYGRHLTQAGAAMKTWEAMLGEKAPQSEPDYFAAFSPFYFGGRVQCFQTGHVEGPLEVYDINSAYPWAMLDEHPYGLDYVTVKDASGFRPTSFVTVRCRSAGALPWRDERGLMQFPADAELRTFHVTGHELQAGIDTGTVSEIELLSVTDHVRLQSFRDYMERFYNARMEARARGNKADDIFAKLLMASLYGKFGANPDNYGNFLLAPWSEAEDYEYQGYVLDGTLGNLALLRAELDEWQKRYYNVATAASITGKVRAFLWRSICLSSGVVYADTDSLICRNSQVSISDRLGDWKHEGTASDAWIAGKKLYYLAGRFDKGSTHKSASKGVRLSVQEIQRVAMGDSVTFVPDAPTFRLRGEPVFTSRTVRKTA